MGDVLDVNEFFQTDWRELAKTILTERIDFYEFYVDTDSHRESRIAEASRVTPNALGLPAVFQGSDKVAEGDVFAEHFKVAAEMKRSVDEIISSLGVFPEVDGPWPDCMGCGESMEGHDCDY